MTLPFHDLIDEVEVQRFLEASGNYRRRIYPPDVTLRGFLAQAVGRGRSCQDAVTGVHLERKTTNDEPSSFNTSCYTRARRRLNLQAIKELCCHVHATTQGKAREQWLWKGRRVAIIDGSSISMADTSKNLSTFAKSGHRREHGGFPKARLLLACSLETGSVANLAIASWQGKLTGEIPLAATIIRNLEPGHVVVGDAMFVSHFLMSLCQMKGLDLVAPRKSNRNYVVVSEQIIGCGDRLISVRKPQLPHTGWLSKQEYDAMPDTILLRETQITVDRPGFRAKKFTVLSTLTDVKAYSPYDIGHLLKERWNIETDLRIIKRELGLEFLRAKSPDMVEREIWIKLLAFNLVRRLINAAATLASQVPRRISFKRTLEYYLASYRAVRFATRALDSDMAATIARFTLPKQLGRTEPRAKKSNANANDYPVLTVSRARWRLLQVFDLLSADMDFSPMLRAAIESLKCEIPQKRGQPVF